MIHRVDILRRPKVPAQMKQSQHQTWRHRHRCRCRCCDALGNVKRCSRPRARLLRVMPSASPQNWYITSSPWLVRGLLLSCLFYVRTGGNFSSSSRQAQ